MAAGTLSWSARRRSQRWLSRCASCSIAKARLVEGELGVSQRDDEQLGEIEADAVADELEPLAIEFAAELENGRASVSVAQREDGDFDLELDFGAAR